MYLGDASPILPDGYTVIGGYIPDGSGVSQLIIGSITQTNTGYIFARGYVVSNMSNIRLTFNFVCVKTSLLS